VLAAIIVAAFRGTINQKKMQSVLNREKQDKTRLREALTSLNGQ
jgi:hypothetical protein